MKLRKHPGADDDTADGYRWYENVRAGLGGEFLDALKDAFKIVANRPRSFTRLPIVAAGHEVRRFVMKRFPYSVVYDVRANDVVVVAVAHHSRRPDYWPSRLGP
jgi:toxin ParE1/3/4